MCILLFYSYLKIPGYRTTTFSFGTDSKAGYSMFQNTPWKNQLSVHNMQYVNMMSIIHPNLCKCTSKNVCSFITPHLYSS